MSKDSAGELPTNAQKTASWQAVIDDMAVTSEGYRERGWTTLELHPGDSVFVDSEYRTGLDVLLPGPEHEDLEPLVEDCSFTESEVFRTENEGLVYLLIIEKDPKRKIAVFTPAYYDLATIQSKLDVIEATGQLRLFCRRLDNEYVEFVHDDPSPFLPDIV